MALIEKSLSESCLVPDPDHIPAHVAIIMDGNRRWAKKNHLPISAGHLEGAAVLKNLVQVAIEYGVKIFTVYAFSTENWNRSVFEIESLMELFRVYLQQQKNDLIAQKVRLKAIGDLSALPVELQMILEEVMEATAGGSVFDLIIAVNYGGRDDITRAVKKIAQDIEQKKIRKEMIDESLIASYLDTAQWNDPDLLIRTSGERRLSNFLLWQISYAEMVVSDVLWPEFTQKHFYEAILEYQARKRRLRGS
ncbi:MAG: di-trans,poly-cis-decaprenylcistransferase [Parachlamydiales bacterium]|nr:di-trans,poly-cis-decaprenylcistransferase [Parachlamydiales bacterium]